MIKKVLSELSADLSILTAHLVYINAGRADEIEEK
jgi:hypothetical protein